MYKIPHYSKSLISCNRLKEGETMENKVSRILANKEPIKDGSPLIYTDKKDGVDPAYNIRTDRFELAVDAMDKVHKSTLAKKDDVQKPKQEEKKPEKETKVIEMNQNSGAESIPGTADKKSV